MRVTKINVKVNQRVNAMGVIEMGAEAEVDTNEDWQLAQDALYTSLTKRVEALRERILKDVEEGPWAL